MELLPSFIMRRCPLKVRLRQITNASELDGDHREWAIFRENERCQGELPGGEKVYDFAAVRRGIEERTRKRTGDNKHISDVEILLDIYTPDYPDLQLIDLPGLIEKGDGEQPNDIDMQIQVTWLPSLQARNCLGIFRP